jgi:cation/acetate symporter
MEPWFTVGSQSAGVFGVTAGMATIFVVSLLTKAPGQEVDRFLERVRHTGRRGVQ